MMVCIRQILQGDIYASCVDNVFCGTNKFYIEVTSNQEAL